MNQTWCFVFKKFLFQDWIYATEKCNNAILLVVKPSVCESIVFPILIREKGYFEIILNALKFVLKSCG